MDIQKVIQVRDGEDIRLDITIGKESLAEAIDSSYMIIAEQYEIKLGSFEQIRLQIEKRFLSEDLENMLRQNVAGIVAPFAIDTLDFYPALDARPLSIPKIIPGEAYTFSIGVRPTPIYELSSYDPVVVTLDPFVFDEREVFDYLDKVAEKSPDFQELPEREVREKDIVLIQIESFVNGKSLQELTSNELMLELGMFHMPDDFEKKVIGMRVGEKKSFSFYGPQYDEEGFRTLLHIETTVTVLKLMKKVRSGITDSWVQRHFPKYQSADELKKAVRADLYARRRESYNCQKDYITANALSERIVNQIPDEYFEFSRNLLRKQMIDGIESNGISAEMYFAQKENDIHEHNLIIMMQARELCKRQIALDALYQHEHMEIDDSDIEMALHQMAPGHESDARKSLEKMGRMYEVRQAAKRLKANRWLSNHAIVILSTQNN